MFPQPSNICEQRSRYKREHLVSQHQFDKEIHLGKQLTIGKMTLISIIGGEREVARQDLWEFSLMIMFSYDCLTCEL